MMIQFEPVAFVCDDLDVRAILKEPDMRYSDILERCSGRLYHVYNLVRLSRPDMVSIAVCGGITDGLEGLDFYALDIYAFTREGGCFLPTDEVNGYLSTAGILHTRSLFADLLAGDRFWPGNGRQQMPST